LGQGLLSVEIKKFSKIFLKLTEKMSKPLSNDIFGDFFNFPSAYWASTVIFE